MRKFSVYWDVTLIDKFFVIMRTVSVLRYTVLLYVLVVAVGSQAFAQSTKSEVVTPEGYSNDDVVAVYKDLKKNYAPKSEFETHAAYMKRMQKSYKGKAKFFFTKEMYAIILPAGIGYTYLKYDAENQIVTLKRSLKKYGNKVKIKRYFYSRNEFEASNAYGGRTLATAHNGTDYGILIENGSEFKGKIQFQLHPVDAEALKDNFGIMFVCELNPDAKDGYFKDDFIFWDSILNFPDSYSFSEHYIRVDVTDVVIFNSKTGIVYLKQKIKT